MTLAELIDKARQVLKEHEGRTESLVLPARDTARGVMDLLAEAPPDGWDAPNTKDAPFGQLGVPNQWAEAWVTSDDARAFARMLLAAADDADEIAKHHKEQTDDHT